MATIVTRAGKGSPLTNTEMDSNLTNLQTAVGYTKITADVTSNATANTIADVTGLSFAVVSGLTYRFRFVIPYTTTATTNGSRWSINGPTFTLLNYVTTHSVALDTSRVNYQSVYDTPAAASTTSSAAGNVSIIEGVITPSANGTVIARFASELASTAAIVAKAGSYVQFEAI